MKFLKIIIIILVQQFKDLEDLISYLKGEVHVNYD